MSRFKHFIIDRVGIGELALGAVIFALAYGGLGELGVSLALGGLGVVSLLVLRLYRRLQELVSWQTATQRGFEQNLANLSNEVTRLAEVTNDRFAATASRLEKFDEIASRLDKAEQSTAEAINRIEVHAKRLSGLDATLAAVNRRLRSAERDTDIVRNSVIEAAQTGHFPDHFYTANSFNPEISVLPTIFDFTEQKIAFDVGANRGEFTAALRHAGFAVHAFEPLPALKVLLTERFQAESEAVHIHEVACSDSDGSAQLHLAAVDDHGIDATLFSTLSEHPGFEGFTFSETITVPVRRLDTIFADAAPMSIGLLKTDTEGNDLSVLKGATTIDAAVLMVEFWDKDYVFNAGTVRNSLQDYLAALDRKKYPFWIVMWRGITRDDFGITAGTDETPSGSWGNILFLSNADLVDSIVKWARRTYGARRVATAEISQAASL